MASYCAVGYKPVLRRMPAPLGAQAVLTECELVSSYMQHWVAGCPLCDRHFLNTCPELS